MKIKKVKNIILPALLISLPILALGIKQPGEVQITTVEQILAILEKFIGWLRAFFFVAAVIFILLAAFTYLSSGGDPEKVKSAQNKLIYAMVAIAVALIASGLSFLVANILK